jgi:hypothetical protein
MSSRLVPFVAVFLFACGTASAPTPVGPPDPVPQPVAEDPVVAASQPEPAPVSEEVVEEPAYESNPCEGTDLDLGSLAAQAMCNLDRTAEPLPEGLVAKLTSDTFSIIEGTESEIRVVLTNTTAQPMEVEFDASCRFLNMVELAIYRRSSRIDRVSMQCDVDAKVDCSGHVIGVKIDAGGEAFIRLGVPARVALLGEECIEYPSRKLSPGISYTVKVRSAFTEEPLTATMKVRKLVRLKRAKCASYAAKVAEVAEPDGALRSDVAESLTAQCKKRQPIKEFADCQTAAKTAEDLQKCVNPE